MRIFLRIAHAADLGGTRGAIAQFNSMTQPIKFGFVDQVRALHQISLRDLVIRIRQPFGELRIVGQDQQPAGIEIEPAHG
jgi:hypothetical protein